MEGVTCDKKAQSESVKNLCSVDLFIEEAAIHVHQKIYVNSARQPSASLRSMAFYSKKSVLRHRSHFHNSATPQPPMLPFLSNFHLINASTRSQKCAIVFVVLKSEMPRKRALTSKGHDQWHSPNQSIPQCRQHRFPNLRRHHNPAPKRLRPLRITQVFDDQSELTKRHSD